MRKVIYFIKNDIVMSIAGLAALLSVFLTPISSEYIGYIDFKVLALLFSLMAVVEGLKSEGSFEVLSHAFLSRIGNVRTASFVLVMLCFFLAMAVTNDVALITMVPFSMAVLDFASEKRIIFLIVMETVAANLGSMLTPIGNPQNLYLFSYFDLSLYEFLKITAPICIVALFMVAIITLAAKSRKINVVFDVDVHILNKKRFSAYILCFLLCIFTVAGLLPYQISFAVTASVVFICNKSLLKHVDYGLLLTFVFFFIFVGNVSNVQVIADFMKEIISGREVAAGILSSQVISNVPAAVMLSSFTDNYEGLIIGTNLGGLGTLIASLASLISWKFYVKRRRADKKLYMLCFTGMNVLLLILLILFCLLTGNM